MPPILTTNQKYDGYEENNNFDKYDNDDDDHRWTKFSGVGWYFNKFYPHTGLVEAAQFTVKTYNLNNSQERERTWVISNHQCECCNRQSDQETYLCSPPKKGDTNEHCFVCKSASKAIESGLIDVWKQWTYTAMKEEYLQVTTLVLWQIPPKNCSNKQPRNITEYPLSRQKAATKKWLYQKEQTPWVWDQGQHIIDFTRYDIIAL